MRHLWPALLALVVVLLSSLSSVACYDTGTSNGPITSFEAQRGKITKGQKAKLVAVWDGGGMGMVDNGVGAVMSGMPIDTGVLMSKTTFTLTLVDEDGTVYTQGTDVDAIDPATITSFKPDKVILPGETTNITAVFSGGPGVVDMGIGPVKSGVPVSTGPVAATKVYTLTVTNDAGDPTTAMAEVEAAITPVISSFTAPGPAVSRFMPTELTAVYNGGHGVIDQMVGPIPGCPFSSPCNKSVKTPPVPAAGNTYTLTVTNGLGVKTTKTLTVTGKKEMFATDYTGDMLVFDSDANGDVAPKRSIKVASGKNATSGTTGLLGIVVTSDSIFLANENGTPAISVFGIGDKDDTMPKAKLSGGAGWVSGTTGPYMISMAGTELFVPDKSNIIRVWNTTDTGTVAPKRTIEGALTKLDNCFGTWVDNGELYVSNNANGGGNSTVTVYPQAASGNTAPTRTFPLAGLSGDSPSGILVSGNEIFLCSAAAVTVFDKTSGSQLRQITGSATGMVDQACQCSVADGELFCASDINSQLLVFPATGNGNIAPTRTVKGPNTTLQDCGTVVVF